MFLILLSISLNCSREKVLSVLSVSRSTFILVAPMESISLLTVAFMPSPIISTIRTAAIPIMIPSMVRNDLPLLLLMLANALFMYSTYILISPKFTV